MRLTKTFQWIFVSVFLFGIGRIVEQGLKAQWDFGVYYAAAQAFKHGLSPYITTNLNTAWPERPSQLPFVYPPVTLWAFSFLSLWSAKTAALIFGSIKALALIVWILILRTQRLFGQTYFTLPIILIFAVSFQAPIILDFSAGNISVFESLGLWGAVLALVNSQFILFSLLIAVLAQFKIFTALFAFLPLIALGKKQLKLTLGTIVLTAVFASFNFIFFKNLIPHFFNTQTPLSEHGISNPSSFAFSGALLGVLNGIFTTRAWDMGGWLLIVWFWVTRLNKLRNFDSVTVLEKICFSILVYALIVPRFKDYSYTLILPAAACAFQTVIKKVALEELLITVLFLFYPVALDSIPRTWFSRAFTEYHPYIGLTLLSYLWLKTLLERNSDKLAV